MILSSFVFAQHPLSSSSIGNHKIVKLSMFSMVLAIVNSTFKNNTNALCTYYDVENCTWQDNDCDNETIFTNRTANYQFYVDTPAQIYEPINNTINVTDLPERFDLRD